jgi:RNA polymerase sigma factor (TIGR02999 family)
MENANNEPLAGTLTQLIGQVDAGDEQAQAALCDLVYGELRNIGRRARSRSPSCSLATTDIVQEFFGSILANGRLGQMKNRRYFFTAAAGQMRRLIIDHWRHKKTEIAGGKLKRVELDPWLDDIMQSAASRCGGDLEALNAALVKLQHDRPREHEIVQLKFFAGLTNEQTATTLGISVDTVKRDWQRARARIGAQLTDEL